MTRRGSQAIEIALALPLIVVLSGGAVDVGQYLYLTERVAEAAACLAWSGQELPGSLAVNAVVEGDVPSRRVVVSTTLTSAPLFASLSLLPDTVTVSRTVRLNAQ